MAFCKFVQTYKMQRLLLIILTSFFLITSCRKSAPEGILAEDTMVEMMTEVHLVDGYLSTLSIDSSRKVINSLYGHIFHKYQLDSAGFQRNVDFYLGNPTLAKKLYATINQSMTKMDADFRRADSTIQAKRNDSIQRVQYLTKHAEESRALILGLDLDTLPLSFEKYHKDFMSRAGIAVQTKDGRSSEVEAVTKNASKTNDSTETLNPPADRNKEKKAAADNPKAVVEN